VSTSHALMGEPGSALTRRQTARALLAATIGTTIEWYDFLLYNLVAGLYLGRLFFPIKDPFAAAMAAFATYVVGFAVRPLGAVLFGHLGDRVGRKATLIATLSLMGVATFCVGLVPTYAQIGGFAPALLVLLRLLQGVAVSGEWGGAALLVVEWGDRRRRGFLAAWPQIGIPAGTGLSQLALLASTAWLGRDSYWAWRVPFLLSLVLVAVGLYVRLGVLETPVFARVLEEHRVERTPAFKALKTSWGDIILLAISKVGELAPNALFISFFLFYAVAVLKLRQSTMLTFTLIAQAVSLFTTLYFGRLSDRFGRKRLYMIGAALMAIWAIPAWALIDTKIMAVIFIVVVLSIVVHDVMNGPQGAFIAETFTARMRYSGASIAYQLASLTAASQLLAVYLIQHYHSAVPVGVFVAICAVASFIATALVRDRSKMDVTVEYDQTPAVV
jgi:MFS family permease